MASNCGTACCSKYPANYKYIRVLDSAAPLPRFTSYIHFEGLTEMKCTEAVLKGGILQVLYFSARELVLARSQKGSENKGIT